MVAAEDSLSVDAESPLENLESVKHPLEHSWGFWLFTNKSKINWADNMVQMSMFDTVEDYWSHYHHTKQPSELQIGQDYAVFKQGIRPMWEDEVNKQGGRWIIVPLGHTKAELDSLWLDVVLLMIGESFGHSDLISGSVVNVRAGTRSKISLWTRTRHRGDNLEIGKILRQQLGARFNCIYCKHESTKILFAV